MSAIVIPFSSKTSVTLDGEEMAPAVDPNHPVENAKTVDNPATRLNDRPMTDVTRQEVDAKLAASESKLEARLANFDASIKTGFAELRADMAKMQSDMHKNTADFVKWGVGFAVTIVAATVGLLTFINKASEKVPSVQPQASPPIVIYAQPPAPATVTPPKSK